MSKTKRHTRQGVSREYWSKRPMSGTYISDRAGTNRRTKQITMHIERGQAKRELRKRVEAGE